jgi:hypothetical protein
VSSIPKVSRALGQHGLEGGVGEPGGQEVGPLAGGGHGGVGGPELVSDAGRPQPAGDGAPAGGEDSPDEEADEPGGGAGVEQSG